MPSSYCQNISMNEAANDPGILWRADLFDVLPLSTSANAAALQAALTNMGFTFSRASAATVQTSASTVVSSGITNDVPRVGTYGLVLEETRENVFTNSQQVSATAVGAAVSTVTDGYVVGTDGSTLVDRQQVSSGNFGRYQNSYVTSVTRRWTMSQWARRGAIGVASSQGYYFTSGAGAAYSGSGSAALTDAWARYSVTCATAITSGSTLTISPAEARTIDTITAADRDAVMDHVQVEAGNFATEAIITTGAAATRATDYLSSANAQRHLVRDGRVRIEMSFIPKGIPTDATAATAAFFAGNLLGCLFYINPAGYIIAQDNSGGITPTGPVTWLAGETVDVYFEFGNGAPLFVYRRNGGAKTAVTFNAGSNLAITSTTASFFNSTGLNYPLSVWARRIRSYAPGRKPLWAM